jgi:hypothetical protein
MSKKTRKKVSRRVIPTHRTSMKSTENKGAASLSETNKPAAVGKTYYTDDELKHRYAYVASDLKRIALIAVPMILGLIILSWFVKF